MTVLLLCHHDQFRSLGMGIKNQLECISKFLLKLFEDCHHFVQLWDPIGVATWVVENRVHMKATASADLLSSLTSIPGALNCCPKGLLLLCTNVIYSSGQRLPTRNKIPGGETVKVHHLEDAEHFGAQMCLLGLVPHF